MENLTKPEERENPDRGRGGFREELRTIPSTINASMLVAQDPDNVGQPIDVVTNFVEIKSSTQRALHRYRLDFTPNVESETHRRELFRSAARQHFERLPVFDGVHECRSRKQLADKVVAVDVASEFANQVGNYKVTFTHTGVASTGPEVVRSYNMELKSLLRKIGFFEPQRGLHVSPANSVQVEGQNLRILRGFRTSASIHDNNRVLMNFEGSHKLFQMRSVLQIMNEIRATAVGRGQDFREAIRAKLIGKIVVTSYMMRVYRIEDVDFNSNPRSTFMMKDQEISFADYIKNKYNKQTTELNQPLLVVVPNNRRNRGEEPEKIEFKLIPELCNIAGLTDEQRVNNSIKLPLIRATQMSPSERVNQLRSFLNYFHSQQDVKTMLQDFAYNYDKEPVRIKARTWETTEIRRLNQAPIRAKPNDANFDVDAMSRVPNIQKMVIIYNRNDIRNANQIDEVLRMGFEKIKVRLQASQVQRVEIQDGDSPAHYARKLKSLTPPVTIAICVMSSQNKALYDTIKKAATSDMGLLTQCVTSRLLLGPRGRSAATKIAIQVVAKTGGEPWFANIPLKGCMICGYDTYHDTAKRGRSFGAFLASTNENYTRWFSKADDHEQLNEMSSHIATNMLEALECWRKLNGKLPDRIIIYRDGVGDGQIGHVYDTELKSLRERIASVNDKIRLTFIIVNKRIGARFYQQLRDGSFGNPRPGTVIDHTVNRPERFDFYLVSQSTTQGTITPTYYNIIYEDNALRFDVLQRLTFKLCSLYFNWTGTVRVPAPCQYAHKLAYLCGEHLHGQPNANLNEKLHFL